MSFMAIMALPTAMNLLGGLFSPKPPAYNPSYFSSLSTTMAKHSADMQKMWEKPPTPKKIAFDFDVPDFPAESGQKFEQLQNKQETERMTFLNKLQSDKAEIKDDFFAKNHYETKQGEDGKQRVAMKDGKPIVQKGPENPQQKVARQSFEATTKAEMFAKHHGEKTEFVQQQKGQIMTFLDGNKFQLHNPGIQGELQKLVADGQKKALDVQDKHEREFYKVDLPPVDEVHEKVDKDLDQYRQLQQKQMEEQEKSPASRELQNYQADLVALLDAKREEARDQKRSEMFLMDPRKMMMNPPKEDMVTVLPMNLVVALEQYGINSLPT